MTGACADRRGRYRWSRARPRLRQRDISFEVVERVTEWDPTGTGLYLPGNAVRGLGELGIGPAVAARANPIGRQRFLDHRGRRLADIDVDRFWDGVGRCLAINRAALHEVLREANAETPIRLGTAVTDVEDGAAPRVRLIRRLDRQLRPGRRRRRHPFDDPQSRPWAVHPLATWDRQAGASSPTGFPDIADWTVMLGRGRAFLTVALGQGLVYCYADVNTGDPDGARRRRLARLVRRLRRARATSARAGRNGVLLTDRGGRSAGLDSAPRRPRRRRRARQLTEHGAGRGAGGRGRPGTGRDARHRTRRPGAVRIRTSGARHAWRGCKSKPIAVTAREACHPRSATSRCASPPSASSDQTTSPCETRRSGATDEGTHRDVSAVGELGTTTTTLPHGLCRVLAGRSRSQPIRESRKCLL